MEIAVDCNFGIINLPSNPAGDHTTKEGAAACATENDMQVDWDFTREGIDGGSGLIIDEISDLQDENSDFSSEGTVLLLDDECLFSSAETPDTLSGEEGYVHDAIESDSLLYGVPMPTTLQTLSKVPFRLKQEFGLFDPEPSELAASEQLPATPAPVPVKPMQAASASAKAGVSS